MVYFKTRAMRKIKRARRMNNRKYSRRMNGRIFRSVNRLINYKSETKQRLVTTTGGTTSTTSTLVDLTSIIDQGINRDQRSGDSLFCTFLNISGEFIAADTYNWLRIIIFCWNDATAPTASNILTDTSLPHMSMIQPYQVRYGNFKILRDVKLLADVNFPSRIFKINMKINKKVKYENNSTTSFKNGIWMLHCSDSNAVAHPDLDYQYRIYWKDS